MVATASLVISITSLVGVLLTALLGYLNYQTDYLKRKSESRKVIQKYKDPLLLSAADLQSRISNILTKQWPEMLRCDDSALNKQWFYYTFYVFGQFFSWVHILRHQTQFLCFSVEEKNRDLAECLNNIKDVLARGDYYQFQLWRGQQMAIGEIMTERAKDEDELYCIGYSTFVERYQAEDRFRLWFLSLADSLTELARMWELKSRDPNLPNEQIPEGRLRHLQHLLVDLVNILEPEQVRLVGIKCERCDPERRCSCSFCRRKWPWSTFPSST